MNRIYSTDECNDLDQFLKEIQKLQREGKIEWVKEDIETYKIIDLDLSDFEILEISKIFEKLDVYEIGKIEEDEEDWNLYYDEDEDDYDGYSKRKKYDAEDDF